MDLEMMAINLKPELAKAKALKLLASGDATLSEVAALADVSRQCAYYWARAAGIEPNTARNRRLLRLWARTKPKRR